MDYRTKDGRGRCACSEQRRRTLISLEPTSLSESSPFAFSFRAWTDPLVANRFLSPTLAATHRRSGGREEIVAEIIGAIRDTWQRLGGEGFFGPALDIERPTFDGVGRAQSFSG